MQSLSVFLILLASAPALGQSAQIRSPSGTIVRCTRLSDEPALRRVQESGAFQAALAGIPGPRTTDGPFSQADVDRFCEAMVSESPGALGGRSLVSFPAIPTVELVRALIGVAPNEVVLLNPVVDGTLQAGLDETAWTRFLGGRPRLVIGGRPQYVEYACLLYAVLENSFPGHPCDHEDEFSVTSNPGGGVLVALVGLHFRVVVRPDGSFDRLSS